MKSKGITIISTLDRNSKTNPCIDINTNLPFLLKSPSCIFRMYTQFLGSTVHFVCKQHFPSSNQHTETCGNTCLHLDMACAHCILGNNSLVQSSKIKSSSTCLCNLCFSWVKAVPCVAGSNH